MATAVVNGLHEGDIVSKKYDNEIKASNNIMKNFNNNDSFTQAETPNKDIRIMDLSKEKIAEIPLSSYENGPDQVIPTELVSTSFADGCVKIHMGDSGPSSYPPISIPGMLQRTVAEKPNDVALSFKRAGIWNNVTYKEYEQTVHKVAKAFIKLGLERQHGVCIIGFNSPEWFYSNLGAIYAGGLSVGVYTTNSPEACLHNLEGSKANICVVEDHTQLMKILAIKNRLPSLKAIIQYNGQPLEPGVLSWCDLIKLGEEQTDDELNLRLKKIAINQCSTLIYTSGTEGLSKGVMLSHDNVTWDAYIIAQYLQIGKKECVVSYLPLSHIAAQVADIYLPILVGAKVAFADKDALKGSLIKTLNEVKPTVFLGVPRVWEKIYEKMMAVGKETTGLKKTIATWGKSICLDHHMNVMKGNKSETYGYKFYRWAVFSKVKAALGLDKCRYFISAAAPISVDIKKYFMSLDIPLTEAFGMSECAGAHAASISTDFHIESVGKALPGVETKLDNKNEDGHGEICMRGRHVFMGYINEPEKTRETIDAERWLHCGDIGVFDENQFLRITGRIKEILITAGGENIAPVLIEHIVKQELPCVSNAQLIGDRRKFLSILLTLKTEVDVETGEPLDVLSKEVKEWCRSLGHEINTVKELLEGQQPEIMDAIQAGIDRANVQAISNAQKIQKFKILPADFSLPTGELGPTLKLKRGVVYEKYKDLIEEFYKE